MDTLTQAPAGIVLSESTNNKLPAEILADIATRLPRRKLRTLVCVCRSWNAAITPELYQKIDIKSKEQFDLLIDTLINRAPHKRLGPTYITTYNPPAETTLPMTLFPLIVEITTPIFDSKKMYLNLREWNHLRSIEINRTTRMPKNFPMELLGDHITKFSVKTNDLKQWLGVIAKLPGIEELEICGNYGEDNWWVSKKDIDEDTDEEKDQEKDEDEDVTYEDLERLHQWLPRLRQLHLGFVEPYDDTLPDHIIPCDTVRELSIGARDSGSWGDYFARKYTHLEVLTIYPPQSGFSHLESDTRTILKSCAHLKQCWGASYEFHYNSIMPPDQFLDAFIHFHTTLSEVTIFEDLGVPLQEVITSLRTCPLEYLYMNHKHDTVDVDYILDALSELRTLYIRGNAIGLLEAKNQTVHRKLKRLSLEGDGIDNQMVSLKGQFGLPFEIYYPHRELSVFKLLGENNFFYKLVRLNEPERIRERGDRPDGQSGTDETLGDTLYYLCRKDGLRRVMPSDGKRMVSKLSNNNNELCPLEYEGQNGIRETFEAS
ncbi:hypothetical protein EC973_002891 [Apophysomyces ossiformis]|uniref:F-box domain-containing protein n=1 Tax=Apophysomyces ossiformis TaxID=679940 RepID=A0A8H7BN27_9FUNG|nr:hypothetical protein EC973_002891 [Apophysomyces ossiformis]